MCFLTIPLSLTMFQVRLICFDSHATTNTITSLVESFINSKPDRLWINTDFSQPNTDDEEDEEKEDLFTQVAVSRARCGWAMTERFVFLETVGSERWTVCKLFRRAITHHTSSSAQKIQINHKKISAIQRYQDSFQKTATRKGDQLWLDSGSSVLH